MGLVSALLSMWALILGSPGAAAAKGQGALEQEARRAIFFLCQRPLCLCKAYLRVTDKSPGVVEFSELGVANREPPSSEVFLGLIMVPHSLVATCAWLLVCVWPAPPPSRRGATMQNHLWPESSLVYLRAAVSRELKK